MTDRIIPQTRFCWHGATPENMLVITLKLLIEDVMTWWSNILVQTVLVATSWPITNTCPTFVITWCSNTLVQTVLAATSWPITNACPTFVITWCSNSLVQTVLAAPSWHDKSQTPALTLVITDSQDVMIQNSPVYLYRLCWRQPLHDN